MKPWLSMTEAQEKEYHTVILGALLHDVGKYIQRARGKILGKGKHPKISSNFVEEFKQYFNKCVDAELLKILAKKHHESNRFEDDLNVNAIEDDHLRSLARLVSFADNMASYERAKKSEKPTHYRKASLASVFHLAQLINQKPILTRYLPITHVESINNEPQIFSQESPENDLEKATNIINQFYTEFSKIVNNVDWRNFRTVYSMIYSLFQQYLAYLPADTQTDPPDISLFDHNRMCSAIAACLYQYHIVNDEISEKAIIKGGERCILLGGDISGIQSYLYGISTIGAGGVAKRLRARSFYLQMLSDIASFKIIEKFSLPYANIIMSSGGNFYILLPNLENISGHLDDLRKKCDEWLLENFHGALTLNLAWVKVADRDFGLVNEKSGFGNVLNKLRNTLRKTKLNTLSTALVKNNEWKPKQFEGKPFPKEVSDCTVCGRFPISKSSEPGGENDICLACHQDLILGSQLPQSEYIIYSNKPTPSGIQCFDWSFYITKEIEKISEEPYYITRINNPDLNDVCHYPANYRFLANYVSTDSEGKIRTFEEIATMSSMLNEDTIRGFLAVIKIDVDHLGQVFSEGLGRDSPPGFDTASRIATLSRFFDHFFTGWIHWLLKNEFPFSYTVYSGGDDLFIVSSQTEALKIVSRIQEGFCNLTNNIELTISAGIIVVKPNLPIAHTAEYAEMALKEAKKKRNQLCIMNHLIEWNDLPLIEKTVYLFEKETPKSAFLYQLLRISKMWIKWRQNRDPRQLRFIPLLAWTIIRNLKKGTKLFYWATRLIQFNVNNFDCTEAKIMKNLALIVKWEILNRRGRKNAKKM